jgi:hypothetical protein
MTLDLTSVLTTLITGLFSVLAVTIPLIINSRMKDQTAAATLSAAVKNATGAMAQSLVQFVGTARPSVPLPAAMSAQMAVGVQYVFDHAGTEAARFGITQAAIQDKINAQLGLLALTPPAISVAQSDAAKV